MGIDGVDNLKPDDGPHEIFYHKCKAPNCKNTVAYDDEPWCWRHETENEPIPGYSAKIETTKTSKAFAKHNIFKEE